jgi:predicted HD superfamily hydrolase involved in NAD metabolism
MSARASTESPDPTLHARLAAERLAEAGGPLTDRLTGRRWRHTLGVAETAYLLAGGLAWSAVDRERAVIAGLLHDVAKELPRERQRQLVGLAQHGSAAPDGDPETLSGPLLHAAAGAILAERAYAITDAAVLEAIALHPVGAPAALPLVQLLFVADYLEPGRPHLDDEDRDLLARGRRGDLSLATLYCRVAAKKIAQVRELGLPVHPRTVAAWRSQCEERG